MADSAAAVATPVVATPKKAKASKPKAKVAPTHPKTADMVNAAITNLKERGGSSLQAIKKYVASTYKVDVEKLAPFIKKYLKSAVASGSLVQTKGKGASGSFKLSATTGKAEKKAAPKKKTGEKKVKKTAAKPAKKTGEKKAKAKSSPKKKSAAKPKKAAAEKKKAAPKAKKPKTPKKEKKAKTPKKPKSPKPKKAAAKKAAKK